MWKLEEEINSMILKVVKQRTEASYEKDLLQMVHEGAKSCNDYYGLSTDSSRDKFIVDNCKNIYFAGHETTAITATWSLMLLAAHPEWQARARAEVLEVCGDSPPDANMLRNMKTLTMVIQETLRLYPPAAFVIRAALEDITFKDIMISKGMNIQIPVPILQQQCDLWGPDAHKFNPERFAHGIVGACKTPQAYMPFGVGPHVCAGQHFAMTELKVISTLILSKFCFSLSPGYQHSPAFRLVIVPEHGVTLRVRTA
nr:cytochrome P450 714C2-like isoform X1 [Quercus suber]